MMKLVIFLMVVTYAEIVISLYTNLTLLSKNRSPRLARYEAFADAVLMSFSIPENTIFASFSFVGSEEDLSIFGCTVRNVSIYLKQGSPPAINPDGAPVPEEFHNIRRSDIFDTYVLTNESAVYVNLTSPDPGMFYAAVFLSYEDPRFRQISQQGLTRACSAYIDASVYVKRISIPTIISESQLVNVTGSSNTSKYYMVFVPNYMDNGIINIHNAELNNVTLRVQARKPPSSGSFILQQTISNSTTTSFWTEPYIWHYIEFEFGNEPVALSFEIKYFSSKMSKLMNTSILVSNKLTSVMQYKQYELIRDTSSVSFTFSYKLLSEIQLNKAIAINLTSNEFAVLKFTILKGTDIGGTLQYILAFKPRVRKDGRSIILDEEPKEHIVLGCLQRNSISVPVWPDSCSTPNSTIISPLVLNKTKDNATVLVPYPESGTWYASFKLFCGPCVPCNCSDTCQQKFRICVEHCEVNCEDSACGDCTETCKEDILNIKDCSTCDCDGPCLKSNSNNCNSSIIFDVSSRPCYYGDCGKQGQCVMMVSGGVAYSTCLCSNNYRGFDCSDGSLATPYVLVLLEFLLLILSNIFFVPVTYLAYRRRYYVEAVAYFSIFLSSTFYHACDAGENILTFCLFRLSVLQFADFFSAVLAIWLTLLAMAELPTVQLSILQMAGSILIAFCVTLNRYALWIFALPSSAGVLIISISWYLKYRKYKQRFILKSYMYVKLPVGVAIVTIGLIIYGMLQTQDNYKYLHSLWHMIMAAGVYFLLPTKETFQVSALL